MSLPVGRLLVAVLISLAVVAAPDGETPTHYRFSFPEPEHHWMQVEMTLADLGAAPLQLRMSRSSPGRYSLHDFAKNVYDVHAFAADGREIPMTRPDAHGWQVTDHGGAARVTYKIFGDWLDGTYLAIDTTHAHLNMPAAVMWARGLEDRPAALRFDPPAGRNWQIATQLHPASTPFEFTAPNLQYLMDSPVEFGPITMRQFRVADRAFRLAVHHAGAPGDVDALASDVEKIVREEGEIFGEYPAYDPGHYTFIADYLPYADGDGMEHRNSTVVTSPESIRGDRLDLLDTLAHEFFHGWNVERIRPRSIEPFDLERENPSGELWLAEGFTQYYAPVVLSRAGLVDVSSTARTLGSLVGSVLSNPARTIRSAEDMSRMAVFTDGGSPPDRTNWSRTFISYYQFGGAIALALDLTLRDRSDGRVTLDDYMRAMWRVHGKPGGSREGFVDRPYTIADAEMRLAEVSGDRSFAREFFARYIQGHDVVDYAALLSKAGFELQRPEAGRAWLGAVRFNESRGVVRVGSQPPIGTPAYEAGLEVDDEIQQLDGTRIRSAAEVAAVLQRHKPGDRIAVAFADRSGETRTAQMTLLADPAVELVPIERTGRPVTAPQRVFRERWLN
jgi:predicted metalloprotease with PDZ domain